MTLGTNASLAEQIEYAPSEINFALIVEALQELEEWRELLGEFEYCANDVQQRINYLEDELKERDDQLEKLQGDIDELVSERYTLECRVGDLEDQLEPHQNQA